MNPIGNIVTDVESSDSEEEARLHMMTCHVCTSNQNNGGIDEYIQQRAYMSKSDIADGTTVSLYNANRMDAVSYMRLLERHMNYINRPEDVDGEPGELVYARNSGCRVIVDDRWPFPLLVCCASKVVCDIPAHVEQRDHEENRAPSGWYYKSLGWNPTPMGIVTNVPETSPFFRTFVQWTDDDGISKVRNCRRIEPELLQKAIIKNDNLIVKMQEYVNTAPTLFLEEDSTQQPFVRNLMESVKVSAQNMLDMHVEATLL